MSTSPNPSLARRGTLLSAHEGNRPADFADRRRSIGNKCIYRIRLEHKVTKGTKRERKSSRPCCGNGLISPRWDSYFLRALCELLFKIVLRFPGLGPVPSRRYPCLACRSGARRAVRLIANSPRSCTDCGPTSIRPFDGALDAALGLRSVGDRSRPIRGIAQHMDPPAVVNDGAGRGDRQPMLPFASEHLGAPKKASGSPVLRELC